METKEYDGALERRVLSSLIACKQVANEFSSKWERPGLFRSSWANEVGGWAVSFFRKHKEPLDKHVFDRFTAWAAEQRDRDQVRPMEQFLGALSEEWKEREGTNPAALVDQAARYFRSVAAERVAAKVSGHLAAGQLEQAEEVLAGFRRIQVGCGSEIRLLEDEQAVRSVYAKGTFDPVVEYPGALGELFGRRLARDCFVAFMAPQKAGKTAWMVDMAVRALEGRKRVAYLQVGDLSEDQAVLRFLTHFTRMPPASASKTWPLSVHVPTGIKVPKGNEIVASVHMEPETFEAPHGPDDAWDACCQFLEKRIKTRKNFFRIRHFATYSITVEDVAALMESWAGEGWCPDMVVIDYADNFARIPGCDPKDHINETWAKMRGISEVHHCLLVTATQTNADAYELGPGRPLTRRNFSWDNRKLNHVTMMLGINVAAMEKRLQVSRINVVAAREGEFNHLDCVHVGGCLAIGRPALVSAWGGGREVRGEDRGWWWRMREGGAVEKNGPDGCRVELNSRGDSEEDGED